MNVGEVKVHVRWKKEQWNAGASGEVTLGQLKEMAMVALNVPLIKPPRILLDYQGRGWVFPDYYTLRQCAGFAHSYDIDFKLIA